MRMEKLAGERLEAGDDGRVEHGTKVSKKVLSPLMCFTVTGIAKRKWQVGY